MFYKIRTPDSHPQGKFFAWMAFMVAVAICLPHPILPNFIDSVLHSDSKVSVFFSFLAIVTLIGGLTSGLIFKRVERTTVTKASLFILALSTFFLIFVTRFTSIAVLVTIKTWMELLLQIVLALFVRDFAKAKNLGKEESLRFKFQNIGALVGLLVGGFLASQVNYEIVFIAESLVIIFALGYFHKKHILDKHPAIINSKKVTKESFFLDLKGFFQNTERLKIYIVATAHMLWICFKYLYIPLYVINSGYLSSMSGLILAIAMIPMIIFETKTGDFGEIYGVRKVIAFGFFFIGVLLAMIFLSPWPLLNFGLLAIANTGAAFVEPLREEYFLKNTSKEEEDRFYGIYGTADPVACFLSPAIGALILVFLPFKFLFIIFGAIMLLAGYFSWTSLKH